MKIRKLILCVCFSLFLDGCGDQDLANKPYFKNYIGTEQRLSEVIYLGKVKNDLPVATLNVVCNENGLHILFKEGSINYMKKYDVIEGTIFKLEIGTRLKIDDMIYRNYVDDDAYYACGYIFHPVEKQFVPFQYSLTEVRRIRSPNQSPSKIMTYIFGSKKSETVTTILEKLPWDEKEIPDERIIDKRNLYF